MSTAIRRATLLLVVLCTWVSPLYAQGRSPLELVVNAARVNEKPQGPGVEFGRSIIGVQAAKTGIETLDSLGAKFEVNARGDFLKGDLTTDTCIPMLAVRENESMNWLIPWSLITEIVGVDDLHRIVLKNGTECFGRLLTDTTPSTGTHSLNSFS